MKHNLKISVSKKPKPDGLVSCKAVMVKERLLKKLFGANEKVMIIVPGDMTGDITISEVESKGGDKSAT